MERLTKATVGCFKYDLKDHKHEVGEFGTYAAFFNYSKAVIRLGEYEDSGLAPDELILCDPVKWGRNAAASTVANLPKMIEMTYGIPVTRFWEIIRQERASMQLSEGGTAAPAGGIGG